MYKDMSISTIIDDFSISSPIKLVVFVIEREKNYKFLCEFYEKGVFQNKFF